MILSKDAKERKETPITSGLLHYFPRACAAVANASWHGNQQHHPDKPLFWDRTKSTDHLDCIGRHLVDAGAMDTDGVRHSTKMAWRAFANLELELEAAETEEGEYDLATLEKVEQIILEVEENCTNYSSPLGRESDRAVIQPHLDAILDEVQELKDNAK